MLYVNYVEGIGETNGQLNKASISQIYAKCGNDNETIDIIRLSKRSNRVAKEGIRKWER